MGFSQKMCLPAFAAASVNRACVSVDEHTSTASMSLFASTAAGSSEAVGMPNWAATFLAASPLTSAMARMRADGMR